MTSLSHSATLGAASCVLFMFTCALRTQQVELYMKTVPDTMFTLFQAAGHFQIHIAFVSMVNFILFQHPSQ